MSEKRPGEPEDIGVIFVAVASDPARGEGIVGMPTGAGMVPLVCSSRRALSAMREALQETADRSGETVRIVRFRRDQVLETIRPRGTG